MNKLGLKDFVNSLNHQFNTQFKTTDLEKQFTQGIGGSKVKHIKTIAQLYKQYLDKYQDYNIQSTKQKQKHTSTVIDIIEDSKPKGYNDIVNPFDKQNKIKDYKLKPLKQFYRPYFSKSLGSWEIDIVFDGKQDYLFCININTKYLVVYEIQNKTSVEILQCLDQLIKQQHVTNLRSDGESAIGSKMVQVFYIITHLLSEVDRYLNLLYILIWLQQPTNYIPMLILLEYCQLIKLSTLFIEFKGCL
ncbi:MAG: hypothetical protein EZS28_046732 [Streblomastix strix]|uniref:Integrase catalytic domain-containing protein n=1 Tax=Streblomastix strix TaxID=222440 RepID=A0A5J4TJP3_9EUKA|nr:MAG: hypothetical protein EZS28_046732 [Streblomastix strix]